MLKTVFFSILIFLYLPVFSQSFEKNFLGEDYRFYKGAYLKIDPNAIDGFDNTFYRKLDDCKESYNDGVIYPENDHKSRTDKKKLLNIIFFVKDIVDIKEEYAYLTSPVFVLQDTVSKKLIYFKYDSRYSFSFPFLTSPVTLDLCSIVERRIDDFTGEIKINTPLMESAVIYKFITGSSNQYYLYLVTIGSILNYGIYEAIILFDDGTKLVKPDAKIDVNVTGDFNGWQYSAFIPLTDEDLQVLSAKKNDMFRLYIYDGMLETGEANKFMTYVNCVMNTN